MIPIIPGLLMQRSLDSAPPQMLVFRSCFSFFLPLAHPQPGRRNRRKHVEHQAGCLRQNPHLGMGSGSSQGRGEAVVNERQPKRFCGEPLCDRIFPNSSGPPSLSWEFSSSSKLVKVVIPTDCVLADFLLL